MGKKILILANNAGGLYVFRGMLIGTLLEKGYSLVIGTPFTDRIKDLYQFDAKFIETKIDRRSINPVLDFKLLLQYKKILKEEKPDLVITYTIKPNVYGGIACRICRVPYVANITGLGTAFESGKILKKIATVLNRIALKNAKTVFFENEGNRKQFVELGIIQDSQTHRLNGAGVDLERFKVLDYPKEEEIRFLFIGRVMKEKGVLELFDAMRRLHNDGYHCTLDVLGGYEENMRQLITDCETEGWMTYHGFQNDVVPYIQNAHCFVLPSWHEGMANTNLECAASGRPVITTNIPGCMEAVIEEKTGFLVNKKNSEDLYQAMKRFILMSSKEKVQMGLLGRKHIEAVFDKRKVVEETIKHL